MCERLYALALVDVAYKNPLGNAEAISLVGDAHFAVSFLTAYVRRGRRADVEIRAHVSSEEPGKVGYRFGPHLLVLDLSNELVGPLK